MIASERMLNRMKRLTSFSVIVDTTFHECQKSLFKRNAFEVFAYYVLIYAALSLHALYLVKDFEFHFETWGIYSPRVSLAIKRKNIFLTIFRTL